MKNVLIGDEYIILNATYSTPQEHFHFAKHLFVGINGALVCTVSGQTVTCRGLYIASNVPHTAKINSGEMLVVLAEDTSDFSAQLDARMPFQTYSILSDEIIDKAIKSYRAGGLEITIDMFFNIFGVSRKDIAHYDYRIKAVVRILAEDETINNDVFSYLSKCTQLSQSRLTHLFKEQVKISLASYIAFMKMQKAARYFLNGESLTAAAHHAGFSSSAHMASTCKRMFGLSLSELFIK